METPNAQDAALIFTANTVMIGLSFLIVKEVWANFRALLIGVHPRRRLRALNTRIKRKERGHLRSEILGGMALTLAFFAVSILFHMVSLFTIASTLFEIKAANSNFFEGELYAFIGVMLFLLGMFTIGFVYIPNAMWFMMGRFNIFDSEQEDRNQ